MKEKAVKRGLKMEFFRLNPFIRSVGIYETVSRSEERRTYDSKIIYMISGDISVSVENDKPFHISSGSLLYLPAGTRYKLKGQYLKAAVITFDLTDEFSSVRERIPPVKPEDFDESKLHKSTIVPFDKVLKLTDLMSERDTFIRIANIATSEEGSWRDEISATVKLILLKVAETVDENALPSRMVESLDAYIRENCAEEISNTEIGAIFGYHPFYVSRVLKEKKGITLRQYIIAYRLKNAKKMLELTKKSMAEIAEETGFTDASYFTKTFRQAFGVTPKEWRNKFKEEFI